MSGELLQRKGELLRVTRIAKESSALALELFDFKVKWYHAFYDKEIKQFEQRIKKDFEIYASTFDHFSNQIQMQEEGLSTIDKTLLSMLSVSGHMYADCMRILKATRHRALILCAITINAIALLFFVGLEVHKHLG